MPQISHQLEKNLRSALAEGLRRKEIPLPQFVALCLILSKAETDDELSILTHVFAEDYPSLAHMVSQEKEVLRESVEEVVQGYISHVIRTDPLEAVNIGKAALKAGMTINELQKLFPKFAAYYAQQK